MSDIDKSERQLHPEARRLGVGVKIREKIRGSNEWWVFINYNGKRTSKKVGSKKAALEVAETIQAQLKLNFPVFPKQQEKPAVPILQIWYQRFEQTYLSSAVSASTADSYKYNFKNHILPALGSKPLDQITRADMEVFVASLVVHKKLAKDTIATIVKELRKVLNHAREHKIISENPAAGLGKLYSQAPTRHENIEPLNREEVPLFLKATQTYSPEHYVLFLAALHSGLRQGELMGMQWPDIDWNGNFILVKRSIDRVHRIIVPTKNKKIRRVDLSDELLVELALLRKQRKEEWLSKGKNEIPEWVFCNQRGSWLDASNVVNRHFLKCLERAALRRLRFHDLRHTYASLLLTDGAPIAYVSEQMGHSSIELTVKRYGHLIPGANRSFVNNLPGRESAPYTHPASKQTSELYSTKVRKFKQIKRKIGAGKGIRTPDFNLGKVALYH